MYFLFVRLFLEHVSEVFPNQTSGDIKSDNNFSITKTDYILYDEINVTIPSSPEIHSFFPQKQDDELILHNRQNLLSEIRNYNPKVKVSSCITSKLSPRIISSGPCSPKNSFHICPQTTTTKESSLVKKFIPYTYNNNNIVNEINIPDNLSFANKISNGFHEDVTTNRNNKTHVFDGKQPICCVCSVKITR